MNKLLAFGLRETLFSRHTENPLASSEDYGIANFLSDILPNAYIVASLILFIYFCVGGFLFITSAGSSDNTQKGQQIITNAIIGFVVIFASYWIIEGISILTGVPILGS